MANPDPKFIELIEQIHKCRSLSNIHYDIDQYKETTQMVTSSEKQQYLARFISESNNLDEIRLACAIYLGLTEEALTLREWLAGEDKRKAMLEELQLQLNKEM